MRRTFESRISSIAEDLRGNMIISILKLICLFTAVAYVAAFLYITMLRIDYPFALEWMEGTSIILVDRILSDRLIYVEPSLDYVPLIYPPLYYYVSAFVAKMMGPGFLPLRLVSLLSTLGCMGCIFLIVRKIHPNLFAQIIAVGVFSATFKPGGAWFDVARVDMLALFLALTSIGCLQFSKGSLFFLSGLLMTLSCLTKQSFLIVLITTAFYVFFLDRKKVWLFVLSAVSGYAISFLILDFIHGGWYKYFIYDLPYGHTQALGLAGAVRLFVDLIFWPVGLLFLFAVSYFIQTIRDKGDNARRALVLIVGALLGISWIGLINSGGFNNVIVPSYAILSIVAGLFVSRTLSNGNSSTLLKAGILLLTLVQFALLRYPVEDQIPTADDLHAGQALLQRIKEQPGEVYVPYHPELMLFAGEKNYASWIGMYELNGGFGGETDLKEWRRVNHQLRKAIREGHFEMIILDLPAFWGHPERYYQSKEVAYSNEDAFYPVTGWQVRPTIVYYLENPAE